jgi:hypothetical protein
MCVGPGPHQGQPPRILLIASGIFEGSCRAGPSGLYLVLCGRGLKQQGNIFEPIGNSGELLGAGTG